jgi:hypothetical protein
MEAIISRRNVLVGGAAALTAVAPSDVVAAFVDASDVVALVDASHQVGQQLIISPLVKPLNAGDLITIQGVRAFDRCQRRESTELRQFVITAAGACGDRVISFYPPIIPPSPDGSTVEWQTVSDAIKNRAEIRTWNQ